MLREDNIFYAKRNLVDSIWKEARLEGIAVTFPQTKEIIEGRSVAGLSIDELLAVNNLKHAWEYVFDTLDEPVTLEWIKNLNRKIGEGGVVRYAGDLRTSTVTIGGTEWIPPVPSENEMNELCEHLDKIEDPMTRAIRTLCEISRAQAFNDGNKRTAQLAANKILIENGCGILTIKEKDELDFTTKLVEFYESDNSEELQRFLKMRCIDSPELSKERMEQTARRLESEARAILESTEATSELEPE